MLDIFPCDSRCPFHSSPPLRCTKRLTYMGYTRGPWFWPMADGDKAESETEVFVPATPSCRWPWVGDIPLLGFSSHQPSPGSCQAVLPYCSYFTWELWMITTPQQLLPQNAELSLVGFTLILLNLCDLFSKFLIWVCHLFLARILTHRIKIMPKNKWLIQENMDWGDLKNTFYSNNSKETER